VQLLVLLLQLHHHLLHLGKHEADLLEDMSLVGTTGTGTEAGFQPVNHDFDRLRLPVTLVLMG
jgi:hypothetical protein